MAKKNVRVVLNRAGFVQLRKSPAMQAVLRKHAAAIKARADRFGSGVYEAEVSSRKTRAVADIRTTDVQSIVSNQKHNSLIKALGGGGA